LGIANFELRNEGTGLSSSGSQIRNSKIAIPNDLHPLIAIVGPTASGKSDLAISIAETFNGEIVNYDSVQVFRYLDIGTAKPALEERRRVPHHMIDIREPTDAFSAGDYQREARAVLSAIRDRGRVPVLVGGTGLYLRALVDGLFQGPSRSAYWRERLEAIAVEKGREYLHRLLMRLDPAAGQRIAARDKPKIIRALEVRLETGTPLTAHLQDQPRQPLAGYFVHMIGLDPPRAECYRRIDERVHRMFDAGLVDEVRQLLARGIPRDARPLGAIGYRHVLANLDTCNSWDDTIRIIQRDTRRYAKRQMTWFRKLRNVNWFGGLGTNEGIKEEVHRGIQLLLTRF
jgi:tRNA dimethylallyltransferase